MRHSLDATRVRDILRALGRGSKGPGRVYLTGGTSAVLIGWRASTVDADLKLDPEPPGAFEAIRALKDDLSVNVELASPDQFLPPLPGWRERSPWIAREGVVDFFHYDFYSQALAKISRGLERDLADVRQMVAYDLIDPVRLLPMLTSIEPGLLRYPAVDPVVLRARVQRFVEEGP